MHGFKFVKNIPAILKENDFYFLLKLVGRISPK